MGTFNIIKQDAGNIEIFLPNAEASYCFGRKLGTVIANSIENSSIKLPFLSTLSGDLGAGKTTLCQALCQGLGVKDLGEIVSPSFTLANEYKGRWDIFHLDIYRLQTYDQFYEAGLDEYLSRPGICLLEWPEKMPDEFWPKERLAIKLKITKGGRTVIMDKSLFTLAMFSKG